VQFDDVPPLGFPAVHDMDHVKRQPVGRLVRDLNVLRAAAAVGDRDCVVVAQQQQAITRRFLNPAGPLGQLQRIVEGNRHQQVPIGRPAVVRLDGPDDVGSPPWSMGDPGATVELCVDVDNARPPRMLKER